ncbi:MAG: bifunctional folylpolyglutamate synthase/dihydrofolate synthase, partial [Deltaproteobacteria bacterium]
RLDATNVITPLVCVITNIAMEHQFFLGSRLMDIAGEKAGIIKEGVDLVTGASQPEVVKFFQSVCDEKKAPMFRLGKDFRSRTTATGFHYSGRALRLKKLNLGLRGRFQARNAALALAVIESLKEKGFEVSSRDIRKGLKKVCWPGRMHLLGTEPTLILDGAHNPAAIRTLADCIKKEFAYRRLILVIGIMEDKEIGRIVRNIVPISDYTLYTRPLYPRAADPRLLMDAGAALGKAGEEVIPLPRALDRSRKMAGPEDLILVTGSLFTVGEAMAYLDPEAYGPDET